MTRGAPPRPAPLSRRGLIAGGLVAALAAPGLTAPGVAASRLEPPRPEPPRPEPPRLRRGINLWPWFSLTREYPPPRQDYAWPPFQPGRPVPTAGDLRGLAGLGFDFVRLPLDPGPFLAFTGARRAALLDEVEGAVAAVRAAGLALILNVQANAATHHYTPDRFYGAPGAPLFAPYRDLVAELARRLQRGGDGRVALEPVNEPPQACGAATWTALQGELLGAARAAAPRLALVATGACGGLIPGLVALDPAPLRAAGPTLFSFHFYEPYLFTHQGAPWMREPVYRDLNGVPWPAAAGSLAGTLAAVRARMAADTGLSPGARAANERLTESKLAEYFAARPDRGFVDHHLAAVVDWARRHGIPTSDVVMGEFGALRTDDRYLAAAADDRARYIGDVRRAAEACGFPWALWNLFDGMGLVAPGGRGFDPALVAALGLAAPASAVTGP